jgi:hypothetical protein
MNNTENTANLRYVNEKSEPPTRTPKSDCSECLCPGGAYRTLSKSMWPSSILILDPLGAIHLTSFRGEHDMNMFGALFGRQVTIH